MANNSMQATGKKPPERWLRLVGQCRPFLKWRLAGC